MQFDVYLGSAQGMRNEMPTPGEVALDGHLLTLLLLPEGEISTKPWQVNNTIVYNQGGDIVAEGKKGTNKYQGEVNQ